MTDLDERVLCLNPDPQKTGTRILRSRYEPVQRVILAAVASQLSG